jgi:multicomponent Na+:H+ antiporter subunit D
VIVMVLALRARRMPAPVRWLRALHTGSVNDYAAYATVGFVATAYVLLGTG